MQTRATAGEAVSTELAARERERERDTLVYLCTKPPMYCAVRGDTVNMLCLWKCDPEVG